MSAFKVANNAITTTAVRLSDTDTVMTVASGSGASFPALGGGEYFKVTLQDVNNNYEIVKVTSRTGDTFIIVRGQDGTAASPFPSNSRVELRVIASSLQDFIDSADLLLL
jgi:hypothetical protein